MTFIQINLKFVTLALFTMSDQVVEDLDQHDKPKFISGSSHFKINPEKV